MTKKEQRIAIIKDVLENLDNRTIHNNFYMKDLNVTQLEFENGKLTTESLSKIEKCPACALGQLFISYLKLFGKTSHNRSFFFEINCLYSDKIKYTILRYLSEYFTLEQLDMIESALERSVDFALTNNRKHLYRAATFKEYIQDSKSLMKMICENMLQNDGEFNP